MIKLRDLATFRPFSRPIDLDLFEVFFTFACIPEETLALICEPPTDYTFTATTRPKTDILSFSMEEDAADFFSNATRSTVRAKAANLGRSIARKVLASVVSHTLVTDPYRHMTKQMKRHAVLVIQCSTAPGPVLTATT